MEKQKLRKAIWSYMRRHKIATFPPPEGRIPNFLGAEKAAKLATTLPEWKNAKIIVSNPDSAQMPLRRLALEEGKTLIMASPRLKRGYLLIEKCNDPRHCATIAGALQHGRPLNSNIPRPDLIITGCVAVDKNFYRLGKGGGYGDREIDLIHKKFGHIPVVTTVHDCQIVKKVPTEPHDTKVDIIVTPTKILRRSYGKDRTTDIKKTEK